MQLKEFFDSLSVDNQLLTSKSVCCFALADEAPLPILFASQITAYLKSNSYQVESIDLIETNVSGCITRLETSFLGMGCVYVLRGTLDIDKKYRQALFDYLSTYSGPHHVILFAHESDASHFLSKQLMVIIPETITAPLIIALATWLKKKNTPQTQKYLQSLCATYDTISLDQACMIVAYMQVVGKQEDCTYIFEHILESEKSLFTLSQYFFAKDAASFLNSGRALKQNIQSLSGAPIGANNCGEHIMRVIF